MRFFEKAMLSFKSFRAAKRVLAGIELMLMIRQGQLKLEDCNEMSCVDQFFAMAGQMCPF